MRDRIGTPGSAVVGVVLTAVAVLAPCERAAAEVTITPNNAVAGQPAVLSFAVSDDRADSTTTRVALSVPPGLAAPTAAQPKTGWQFSTGAASELVWTAADPAAGIGPGQFEVFSVEFGPLPTATDRLAFDVTQTYADGSVVEWAGEPHAAHPAPVLTLQGSSTSAAGQAPGAADPPVPAPAVPAAPPLPAVPPTPPGVAPAAVAAPAKPDNTRRVTAGLALGVGLVLLGVAAAGVQQRRRPAASD